MLLKGERTFAVRDTGGFVAHINMPGWVSVRPVDHGYGPLAMVVESLLAPGQKIAMHEHRDDEIVSWVPEGAMHHDDRLNGPLVVDGTHLMVMNAGRSFWHSEENLPSDPPLRMLQIIVRPRAVDLDPAIQYGSLPPAVPNIWRYLAGPEASGAPFHVRSAIDLFDIRLEPDMPTAFPQKQGRHLYFYVFSGSVVAGGQTFTEGEQGLLPADDRLTVAATSPGIVLAFLIDPRAPFTKAGTVGDHRKIPPPIVIRLFKHWLRLRRWWGGGAS